MPRQRPPPPKSFIIRVFIMRILFRNRFLRSLLIILSTLFYTEVLHYGIVLAQCRWPSVTSLFSEGQDKEDLKVMFIADTHILGSRHGHWLDKFFREWQMKRAFQTSMLIHKPDVVFVLGDLMDEGKWCPDEEFDYHVQRFRSMFDVPSGTEFHVVSGNHDEGFHYAMSPHKHERFEKAFDSPSVRLVRIKNNLFVLVNSMAMEGDGCSICTKAERQLEAIAKQLNRHRKCDSSTEKSNKCQKYDGIDFVEPILLQHYPMYRLNDAHCNLEDSAPEKDKFTKMRVRYDCLDQRSTDLLFSKIKPRLVVGAHTHHGCYRVHSNGVPEWSVSSFSSRNRKNPTFLMARVNHSNFATRQCFLPKEDTAINVYMFSISLFLFSLLWPFSFLRKGKKKYAS